MTLRVDLVCCRTTFDFLVSNNLLTEFFIKLSWVDMSSVIVFSIHVLCVCLLIWSSESLLSYTACLQDYNLDFYWLSLITGDLPAYDFIIGKEFQKICYKTIFRKINTEEIFFQLTVITNKDYFFKKKAQFAKIYCRGICHMVVTSLIGASCKYC